MKSETLGVRCPTPLTNLTNEPLNELVNEINRINEYKVNHRELSNKLHTHIHCQKVKRKNPLLDVT